jgi:hypothetical protein
MKITLEPTGRFETVTQGDKSVLCRIWQGTTDSGAKIVAHIPLIGVHESATAAEHEQFAMALSDVETERELVSFEMRMVI